MASNPFRVVITERKLEGEVKQHLGTTSDCDDMSLASYNSADDEKPDVMSSIMTDILYCPYHLDIGRQISGVRVQSTFVTHVTQTNIFVHWYKIQEASRLHLT